jgi:hypothetical protein
MLQEVLGNPDHEVVRIVTGPPPDPEPADHARAGPIPVEPGISLMFSADPPFFGKIFLPNQCVAGEFPSREPGFGTALIGN